MTTDQLYSPDGVPLAFSTPQEQAAFAAAAGVSDGGAFRLTPEQYTAGMASLLGGADVPAPPVSTGIIPTPADPEDIMSNLVVCPCCGARLRLHRDELD